MDGYSLIELVMAIVLATIAFPGIVTMFTSIYVNGGNGELMTVANLLAVEQMEVILADKAGSGAGFGYANITSAKYGSVSPAAPFNAYGRAVTVTAVNIDGDEDYPAKQVVVRVTHPKIPDVILTCLITDHPGLNQ